MSKVISTVNTITIDTTSAVPVIAAAVSAVQAAKTANPSLSLFHRIAVGIEGAATAAETFPNLEVDAIGTLTALVAGLVNLI